MKGKAIRPPSLCVQLGHRLWGRVCITELQDPADWKDKPLEGTQTHISLQHTLV